jgi:RimJ/RimL family protein N-acetyltransferase
MGWLPENFTHPERVELGTGHHLRPIRESDVEIDYPAVMGSRERLWAKYGEAWGWPPEAMTYEADQQDLLHHEQEIAAHETFNYAILDEPESELLGCVYIDPPGPESGAGRDRIDAVVSWWVVDRMVDSELERELGDFVPRWLDETWRFANVEYSP